MFKCGKCNDTGRICVIGTYTQDCSCRKKAMPLFEFAEYTDLTNAFTIAFGPSVNASAAEDLIAKTVETLRQDGARAAACSEGPESAYLYAHKVDHCPRDDTRKAACGSPESAFLYARDVDKTPRPDTRKAANGFSTWDRAYAQWARTQAYISKDAYLKAYINTHNIETGAETGAQEGRDALRTIACRDPKWAYAFARYVDREPCDETRTAACGEARHAYAYARDVDHSTPCDETRTGSCKESHYAYSYALEIDEGPHPNTRTAACKAQRVRYLYILKFGQGYT